MKSKNIGLVLSGGGHRGAAHIGAIKALEEHGIYPNIISGTSAGAMVGALYAADHSYETMLDFFKKVKIFTFSRYARKKPGFVDTDTFQDFLLDYFPDNSFSALSKKLYATATDLISATTRTFENGDLTKSLLASASFPGVFTPMAIDGSLFSDGGILDNFPVDPILQQCDEIYGVHVSPVKRMKIEDFKHSYHVMERAYYLKIYISSVQKFKHCDLVISPEELSNYSLFNANHIDKVFEIGYRSSKNALLNQQSKLSMQ